MLFLQSEFILKNPNLDVENGIYVTPSHYTLMHWRPTNNAPNKRTCLSNEGLFNYWTITSTVLVNHQSELNMLRLSNINETQNQNWGHLFIWKQNIFNSFAAWLQFLGISQLWFNATVNIKQVLNDSKYLLST